ncbi:MAG: ABC transporter ATP-binding protein [Candidatus Acidiferrales bacterium]
MEGDGGPALRFDHVFKSFDGSKVLDDVSFQVAAGHAFCLLGRSGTGKSVTLKLMIGLMKPDRGAISIHGNEIQNLREAKLAEARKEVGFLFQDAALFDSISVAENVAFPLRRHTHKSEKEIRAVVHEKLEEVELGKEGNKMPDELSGGMRKRAGLARALSLDPSILLIDEPSSGLDRITAAEIYQLLLELKKKKNVTLVVVTHDVTGARTFSNQFAVLDNGKIVGCGGADELAQSDNPLVRELSRGSET